MNKTILAFDAGDKYIGVAENKSNHVFVLDNIDTEHLVDFVKEYITKNALEKIIIGLPVNEDGTENDQCKKTYSLAKKIETVFDGEIVLENEFLSSIEAQNNLRTLGYSPKEVKEKEHSEAAKIILEQYIQNR